MLMDSVAKCMEVQLHTGAHAFFHVFCITVVMQFDFSVKNVLN